MSKTTMHTRKRKCQITQVTKNDDDDDIPNLFQTFQIITKFRLQVIRNSLRVFTSFEIFLSIQETICCICKVNTSVTALGSTLCLGLEMI